MVRVVDSVRAIWTWRSGVSRAQHDAEAWRARAGHDQAARRVVAELRAEDRQVRSHEQAHLAIAGAYVQSTPRYGHMVGPDGQAYAVSGSVKVDTAPVPGDPEATLRKARVLMRVAMGTGSPSAADLRIAAEAYRMAAWARREIEAGRDPAPGSLTNVTA